MEENQTKEVNETNVESYKGIVIFLIIFGIVAVTATSMYATYVKNKNGDLNNEVILPNTSGESGEIIEEPIATIDKKYAVEYDEMYFTNNIEISEKNYISGDFIKKETYGDTKYYEENATYMQIDGLKDEEVEKKINQRIRDEVFEMLAIQDEHKIKTVGMYSYANFSNILSLQIYYRFFNDRTYEDNYTYGRKYLNIDLSTGNDIKLEELFLDGVSIKNILSDCIYSGQQYSEGWWEYEQYVFNKTGKKLYDYDYNTRDEELKKWGLMTYDEWESWFIKSNFEENAAKVMYEVSKGDIDFYVDQYSISLISNDTFYYNIDLRNNLESLALYKRFMKDETIFDNKHIVAEEGMCGFSINNEYMQAEKIMDNLLLSCYKYVSDNASSPNYYRQSVEDKIASAKEYALLNPNKMYILGLQSEDDYYANSVKVEMDKDEFEKNKDAILKTFKPDWMWYGDEEDGIVSVNVLNELGIKYVYSGPYYYYPNRDNSDMENDFYLIDSHKELVTPEMLRGLTIDELNIAYNEIFARHGHDFKSLDLREYFIGCLWYRPVYGRTVSTAELSEIENQNLNIIRNEINIRKS